MERILLDIYSGVGEPDGIYAVAQSGDIASQLRLMQHEGVAINTVLRQTRQGSRGHLCLSQ